MGIFLWWIKSKKKILRYNLRIFYMLRRQDSNLRPLGYEPNELPLLHSAICLLFDNGCKGIEYSLQNKLIASFF